MRLKWCNWYIVKIMKWCWQEIWNSGSIKILLLRNWQLAELFNLKIILALFQAKKNPLRAHLKSEIDLKKNDWRLKSYLS